MHNNYYQFKNSRICLYFMFQIGHLLSTAFSVFFSFWFWCLFYSGAKFKNSTKELLFEQDVSLHQLLQIWKTIFLWEKIRHLILHDLPVSMKLLSQITQIMILTLQLQMIQTHLMTLIWLKIIWFKVFFDVFVEGCQLLENYLLKLTSKTKTKLGHFWNLNFLIILFNIIELTQPNQT